MIDIQLRFNLDLKCGWKFIGILIKDLGNLRYRLCHNPLLLLPRKGVFLDVDGRSVKRSLIIIADLLSFRNVKRICFHTKARNYNASLKLSKT